MDDEKIKPQPQPHCLTAAQLLAACEAAGQGRSAGALLLKRQLAEAEADASAPRLKVVK